MGKTFYQRNARTINAVRIEDAKKLARKLMDEHDLEEWKLETDEAKKRFGVCRIKTRTISISRPLAELNEEKHVRDVILHEIAHALAPLFSHHGYEWKKVAIQIGANPSPYYSKEVAMPKMKWTGSCPVCKKEIAQRARIPRASTSCRPCSGKTYNEKYKIVWKKTK